MKKIDKSNVEKFVKTDKGIPLSSEEVMKLVGGQAEIVLYENLYKYDNIDQLLGQHGAVFLLYQQKPSYGHWVAIVRRGKHEIEFFDPYGGKIDSQLKWTSPAMRKKLNMDYPYLTKLFYEAPNHYSLVYNQYPFQKNGNDVATCGRWSALRIRNKHLTLDEFKNKFDIKSKHTDNVVTLLTTNGGITEI